MVKIQNTTPVSAFAMYSKIKKSNFKKQLTNNKRKIKPSFQKNELIKQKIQTEHINDNRTSLKNLKNKNKGKNKRNTSANKNNVNSQITIEKSREILDETVEDTKQENIVKSKKPLKEGEAYKILMKNIKPKSTVSKTSPIKNFVENKVSRKKPLKVSDFNSVKTGEDYFNWIIQPINITNFFKNNWEKQPIIVKRNCLQYYSNLLSCEDINRVLRTQQLFFTKNIDITSYCPSTGVRETHNPLGRATAPQVWDFYSNGCSIRILNPQTYFPKIHTLNASLQEYFECFVGANVYLTPADSQGFAPHYDDIEAFVLQLEGEKKWKLYAPRSDNEILPRYSSGNFTEADLGPPIQEVLLQAGDLMYFPRGFIHQGAASQDKHSLHITLSVYQKNSWADFLETLLPAALKSAIEEDSSFREGLPMHYLSHMGLVHSDHVSEVRSQFMLKLESLMSKLINYAPVDAAADQLGKKFIHDSLPPVLKNENKDRTVFGDGEFIRNGVVSGQAEISLDTRIKLVKYNCIRMVREDETIRIYHSISNSKEYHGEEPQFLDIDEDYAPAVDALINAYPEFIPVENLPIEDDIAKVQIASDLWENGIIMTEETLSYLSD